MEMKERNVEKGGFQERMQRKVCDIKKHNKQRDKRIVLEGKEYMEFKKMNDKKEKRRY